MAERHPGAPNGAAQAADSEHAPSSDARQLSHRLADDIADLTHAYRETPFAQAAAMGELSPEGYAAWLAPQAAMHERLDLHITEHRTDVTALRTAVGDFRLMGRRVRADLAALPPVSGDPEPIDATFIGEAAEHEPLKLFGHHTAREALHATNRYLAGKLAEAWGDPSTSAHPLSALDPHGLGQQPFWARFCRDTDKITLTEHERQAVASAARDFVEAMITLGERTPAPSGNRRLVIPATP